MPYKIKKQGMSRRERALGHQKGSETTVGVGAPQSNEGSEGDFTVRKVAKGFILYIKIGNIWYDVNNMRRETAEPLRWNAMVLENSWVRYDTTFPNPGYSKDRDGFVHLRGVVKTGSSATADITSLPPGFRPTETWVIASVAAGSGGAHTSQSGSLQIAPDGDVNFFSGGSTVWSSLDGVIFYAGN